jgi:hypothetical protein
MRRHDRSCLFSVCYPRPRLDQFTIKPVGQPVQIPRASPDAQITSDLTAHRTDPAKQVLPMRRDRESEFFSLMKSVFVMLNFHAPIDRYACLSPTCALLRHGNLCHRRKARRISGL